MQTVSHPSLLCTSRGVPILDTLVNFECGHRHDALYIKALQVLGVRSCPEPTCGQRMPTNIVEVKIEGDLSAVFASNKDLQAAIRSATYPVQDPTTDQIFTNVVRLNCPGKDLLDQSTVDSLETKNICPICECKFTEATPDAALQRKINAYVEENRALIERKLEPSPTRINPNQFYSPTYISPLAIMHAELLLVAVFTMTFFYCLTSNQ